MKHSNLRALAGLLLAGALLAACADPGVDGGGAAGATSTVPTTVPGNPPLTRPTAPGGGQLTVTGTVRDGVEPGCLLLDAEQGRYLLIGGERSELRAGTRIQVTGRVVPDLMSTCQQGEPLVVASIQPVP